GKARLLRRTGQKTRARSGEDYNVRLAGSGRQSQPRAKSGVEGAQITGCECGSGLSTANPLMPVGTLRSLPTLCFDERRRDVFGYSGVHSPAQFAVPDPVGEINAEADCEPHEKADPGKHWQAKHEQET